MIDQKRLKKFSDTFESRLWDAIGEAGLTEKVGGCSYMCPGHAVTFQLASDYNGYGPNGDDIDEDDSDIAVFEMLEGRIDIFEAESGEFFWTICGMRIMTPILASLMFVSPWADKNRDNVAFGGFEKDALDAVKRALAAYDRLQQWVNEMPVADIPVVAHKDNPLSSEYDADDDEDSAPKVH